MLPKRNPPETRHIRSKRFTHQHSCHPRLGEASPAPRAPRLGALACHLSLCPSLCYRRCRPICNPPHQHRPALRECTARGKCLTRLAGHAHPVQGFSTLDVARKLRRDLPLRRRPHSLCVLFLSRCFLCATCPCPLYTRLLLAPRLDEQSPPSPRPASHPPRPAPIPRSRPSIDPFRTTLNHVDRHLDIANACHLTGPGHRAVCTLISQSTVEAPTLARNNLIHGSYVDVELRPAPRSNLPLSPRSFSSASSRTVSHLQNPPQDHVAN